MLNFFPRLTLAMGVLLLFAGVSQALPPPEQDGAQLNGDDRNVAEVKIAKHNTATAAPMATLIDGQGPAIICTTDARGIPATSMQAMGAMTTGTTPGIIVTLNANKEEQADAATGVAGPSSQSLNPRATDNMEHSSGEVQSTSVDSSRPGIIVDV